MKKTTILLGVSLAGMLLFTSCGNNNTEMSSDQYENGTNEEPKSSENNVDPNSSPESVMNTIFQAAQTGEVGVLGFLLPPLDENGEMPCDGDCKAICNPGNESMREELGHNFTSLEDFKNYFGKGKIIGAPTINGNEAVVNFVFGPNRERNETMNMQKINTKWYLKSF